MAIKSHPCLQCRYGAEQGKGELREAICEKLYKKAGRKSSEIFVSDGSKCDIGRLQARHLHRSLLRVWS